MARDGGSGGALAGVRIVEAAQGVGGPYAAMLLAEQGAEVIKVEPPSGDRLRGSPAFHVLNRSKQGVALDPATESGRDRLRRLLASADVFLHDWQPGRVEALGFDRESLHLFNPRLVIGHLPPYGSRGPYAHLPPDEGLVQAVSGACDAQWRYEEPPVFLNAPIAGYAQGILGAIATAATLYARAHTGRGDRFEVSGIDGIVAMETVAYLRAASVIRLAGRADPHGPIPTYRLVPCRDGWLFVGALTPAFWASLAVAAGIEDTLVDPRFAGAPMGIPNLEDRVELAARLDAAFPARTVAEWMQILEEADVPRAPVLSRAEYAQDVQVRHNGMIVDVQDPELGATEQMGIPVWLRGTPGAIRGPAPRPNEHAALLDRLLDDNRTPVAAPEDAGTRRAPLDGVVVLDLSGFLAGGNCPMLLADMGATVIKVEGPDGDGWRTSGLAFVGSNRGKRALCVDLKRPEGRALLLDLLPRADVLMDNYRAGVLERLGLTWEVVHAANPRLIHCSVTGYGPDGPYAHLPGFDPLMQARSGLMRTQGEPDGEPVYWQIAVCDFATALVAAYGILAALVARERTGEGQRVETCLVNNALAVQAGEFTFYADRPPDPPGGRDLAGRHALYRIYGTRDGWLFLACTTAEHAERFAAATGGALPIEGDPLGQHLDGDVAVEIGRRLEARSAQDWTEHLGRAGVPCAPCTRVDDLFDDPHLAANDVWWDMEHPQWGAVRQTGAVVHWREMAMRMERRAPLLGEHSVEVLGELGVDGERIDRLVREGIVVQAAE
jgi:crotonobetainyl-CoA:carnitine CoA-transferase CaiB-like acyl-CoA transferase